MAPCRCHECEPVRGITGRFVLLIATAAVLPLMVIRTVVGAVLAGRNRTIGQTRKPGGRQAGRRAHSAVFQQQPSRAGLDRHRAARHAARALAAGTNPPESCAGFPRVPRDLGVRCERRGCARRSRVGVDADHPSAATGLHATTSDFYVATPHIDTDALADDDDGRSAGRRRRGAAVGSSREISLEELWRTVDSIKVGRHGYALLLDEHGEAARPRKSRTTRD